MSNWKRWEGMGASPSLRCAYFHLILNWNRSKRCMYMYVCTCVCVCVCVERFFTYKVDICDWHVILIVDWSLAGAPWAGHLAGSVRLHHQLGTGRGLLGWCTRGRGSSLGKRGGGCFFRCWRRAGGRCFCCCGIRSLSTSCFLNLTVGRCKWDCLRADGHLVCSKPDTVGHPQTNQDNCHGYRNFSKLAPLKRGQSIYQYAYWLIH